jgi:hypothetical protein
MPPPSPTPYVGPYNCCRSWPDEPGRALDAERADLRRQSRCTNHRARARTPSRPPRAHTLDEPAALDRAPPAGRRGRRRRSGRVRGGQSAVVYGLELLLREVAIYATLRLFPIGRPGWLGTAADAGPGGWPSCSARGSSPSSSSSRSCRSPPAIEDLLDAARSDRTGGAFPLHRPVVDLRASVRARVGARPERSLAPWRPTPITMKRPRSIDGPALSALSTGLVRRGLTWAAIRAKLPGTALARVVAYLPRAPHRHGRRGGRKGTHGPRVR